MRGNVFEIQSHKEWLKLETSGGILLGCRMPSPRRFLNHSIEELEQVCAASGGDAGTLQELASELGHRKSKRAATLLANVEQRLSGSVPTKISPVRPTPKPEKSSAQPPQPPKPAQRTKSQPPSAFAQPPPATTSETPSDGEGPPLPPHLGEFVVALKEEVEAAKRNLGGSAALLSDGRLIAPVGGGFHYRFQSQRPLRVPPDTPGFLAVGGGNDDISVSVIEIEDLSVVLELPKHIGGSIPQAKLKTDLTMLLLRLIERIETKGIDHHPAADRILGLAPSSVGVQTFDAFNTQLNPEQRLAVGSVLGGDTVFIWGPPGTGKTQTIGEIGAQLFLRQKTLLIASHTNTAVDEALLRIADALKGQFNEGEVLRLGEPVKTELLARPDLILKRVAEKRSAELEKQKKMAEQAKVSTMSQLEAIHRRVDICQWLAEASNDSEAFRARHHSLKSAEREMASLVEELTQAASQKTHWVQARFVAAQAVKNVGELTRIQDGLATCRSQLKTIQRARDLHESEVRKGESVLSLARQAEPYRNRLDALPALAKARANAAFSKTMSDQARNLHQAKSAQLTSAKALLQQTLSVGSIKRMWLTAC